jgi:hypothetical protein
VIKDFFCDFRSKHFIDKDYYGEVHVAYRAWSDRVLTVKKGPDEMEKFRDILWQNNLEHTSEQFRDNRKVITHEVFKVKCDLRVQAKIEGNHETSRLKIVTKNVGGLQVDIFNLTAAEMNDKAIEEFAKYFIGRPNEWAELVKRSPLNQKSATTTLTQRPKSEPQYLNQKPEGEEKRSLFGSIKSILTKEL